MDSAGFKRKLTAILSADVVGYSRLMGEDEAATVKTLETYKGVMFSLIKQHRGRVVDSPGDNLLAEFGSVVDAVQCAVSIQKELQTRNADLPENRRMEFRIGINLGDVIEEDDRIYGDGLNIAARLEALADPGGICVSKTAFDQIESKLPLGYEYMGEQTVKNIPKPIGAYRVLMEPRVTAAKGAEEKKAVSFWKRKAVISIGIIVILAIIAGLHWKFYPRGLSIEQESIEPEQAPAVSDSKEAPKTIAVLPFDNLSADPEQEYFADGIAEELLNSLTRISELEVRGRTSSFYFKDRDEDLRTISKMLNVEYILEGSVRKAGEQVRITVQLINTRKDAHIWSEIYEHTMDDIFAIQENIAQSVADALQITLGVGELGRAPGMTRNMAAYNAFLAGRSLRLQPGRENTSQVIEQLEQAVALDPDFAVGWNALATAYNQAVAAIPERGEEFVAKREAALSRVVELVPETDLALIIAASQSGDMAEVEQLFKEALALNPANYETNREYGWFLNRMGRPKDAIDHFKRLVRMEPLSSGPHLWLGNAYELCGKSDAAVKAMKKARNLTNEPVVFNLGLLVLALEENNRALIDEYMALLATAELRDNTSISDTRDIDQVMHALLDTPEEAGAELRLLLTDPAYNDPFNRLGIAVWASYFGEFELALQSCRESIGSNPNGIWQIWRPIHKGMRRLPEFKDFVREMGLVDYWRTSGKWCDFCHPIGDDDFVCD
jgi:adenylate cyclase